MKLIGALLVLALVAGDPALAARKKKNNKGRSGRAVAAAPARVTPPPASVRQGVELWRASKWDAAVSMWQPFAQDGDADAMFNMGQAYKLGRGVALDKAIASDWYRRAAVKGHLPAQANLGILQFQATEKAEAVRWLKAAADKGEMRAQYVLGIVHWNGDGAMKSLPLAYAYLVRAAAQGLPEATKALNELSQVIPPLDRANGWQIATALANGNGVPAQFQPGIQPPPLLPVTTPPPPVVVAAAPAPASGAASGTSTAALNAAALKAAADAAGEGDTEETQDAAPAAEPMRQPAPAAATPPFAPPTARPSRPVDRAAEAAAEKKAAAAEAAAEKKTAAAKAAADKRAAEKKLAAQKAAEAAKETGWRIQLGTYPNQKTAMQAWTKLAAANKKATKGLHPTIGKFGGNFRLQVGPYPTRDEARDGCKTLEIGKNGCFALNID
ncbi:SPOR domain-containing protein [Sandarakinorhabdus sp.]|uniref:SPOR domain-containing protein n=1 Tax=Sandarakinorhabdus sp. TaxID=1916663 RepID=UPI00286D8BF5|nr:SPOR domain-containing protein [Sandarakinorhabdus sp.]